MSHTHFRWTTKAAPREKINNFRIFSGCNYPNVRLVFELKRSPQALDHITEGLGLHSTDSTGPGQIRKHQEFWSTGRGTWTFQAASSSLPTQFPPSSSQKPRTSITGPGRGLPEAHFLSRGSKVTIVGQNNSWSISNILLAAKMGSCFPCL